MFKSEQDLCRRMKRITAESKKYIALLHKSPCCYYRSTVLCKLAENIEELEYLCQTNNNTGVISRNEQRQREFTIEDLSEYTGKNGSPAYAAVNGIVYDVTNNAAWAAATHFGLTAGKDLTGAFTSCHAAPSALEKLPVVGKLI